MKRIVAPFLLASLPMSVNAAPDRAQYELQERVRNVPSKFCKGLAARFSRQQHGIHANGKVPKPLQPNAQQVFHLETSQGTKRIDTFRRLCWRSIRIENTVNLSGICPLANHLVCL